MARSILPVFHNANIAVYEDVAPAMTGVDAVVHLATEEGTWPK